MKENIIKYIDYDNWYRKQFYEIYSLDKEPMYGITTKLDVTNIYNFSKTNNISFYFSLGHCFCNILRQIEEFNIRIIDNKLAVLENDFTSFICLNENDKLFKYVDISYDANIIEFAKKGMQKNKTQIEMSDGGINKNYMAWFTCCPWLQISSLTNPKSGKPNDFIPRICWDKIEDINGKKFVNVSIEVNHKIIDGFLISKLVNGVQKLISELKF